MAQTASSRDWDGWELWYFGSDYLRTADVPSDHWRVQPNPAPQPHLWAIGDIHDDIHDDTHDDIDRPIEDLPWPAGHEAHSDGLPRHALAA